MDTIPELRLWPDGISNEEIFAEYEYRQKKIQERVNAARLVRKEFDKKVWPKKWMVERSGINVIISVLGLMTILLMGHLYLMLSDGTGYLPDEMFTSVWTPYMLLISPILAVFVFGWIESRLERKFRRRFSDEHPEEAKLLGYIE